MTEPEQPKPCPFCGMTTPALYTVTAEGAYPMTGTTTDPERTALLMLIKNLVQQGCREKSGAYDSGFIGIYAEAMDILVNYGAAEYTGDYEQPFYGRGRSVRFTDKLRDIWDVIRDANQSAKEPSR